MWHFDHNTNSAEWICDNKNVGLNIDLDLDTKCHRVTFLIYLKFFKFSDDLMREEPNNSDVNNQNFQMMMIKRSTDTVSPFFFSTINFVANAKIRKLIYSKILSHFVIKNPVSFPSILIWHRLKFGWPPLIADEFINQLSNSSLQISSSHCFKGYK